MGASSPINDAAKASEVIYQKEKHESIAYIICNFVTIIVHSFQFLNNFILLYPTITYAFCVKPPFYTVSHMYSGLVIMKAVHI